MRSYIERLIQIIERKTRGHAHESHQPWNKSIPRPLEDVKECSEEWGTKDEGEEPALDEIGNEQARSGLIEPVLLLENEGAVYR